MNHSFHTVESVCLEESCQSAPLMCFICKHYKHTKHKMVAVVIDGERATQEDDSKLIMASQDLSPQLAHVTSQEQKLAHLVSLVPNPAIPITLTKIYIPCFVHNDEDF
nr:uncharacterized protein LOC128684442 isoform X1 [Cherax quadricarinatus]